MLIDWLLNNIIELAVGVPIVGVLLSAVKSSAKLINTVVEAVEDDGKLDKEETKAIIEEAKKVKGAWSLVWKGIKSLFKKK